MSKNPLKFEENVYVLTLWCFKGSQCICKTGFDYFDNWTKRDWQTLGRYAHCTRE